MAPFNGLQPIIKNLLLFMATTVLSACATAPEYAHYADSKAVAVENKYYSASITPVSYWAYGNSKFCGFRLIITNKCDNDIELAWDKTFYIEGAQTSGRFMLEGGQENVSDLIFANGTYTQIIYPSVLGALVKGVRTELWKDPDYWWHAPLPAGDNGVCLTIFVENVPIREKLVMPIKKLPM